jgi:hypothetical protein
MSAVIGKRAEAVGRAVTVIMDYLRAEAREELERRAESAAGEDPAAHARTWYGIGIREDEHRALLLRRTAFELKLEQLGTELEVAEIRGDEVLRQAAERDMHNASDALSEVDLAIWKLEQRVLDAIAEQQELMVEELAVELYERYKVLSLEQPFNIYSELVNEPLRRWYLKQRERGAFEVPEFRLLAYIAVRETVFTSYWNRPPKAEDVTLDDEPMIARAGAPENKTEARMQAMLDAQFVHENGDRRIDRSTQLLDLTELRHSGLSAKYDFDADSDYNGLPTLKHLLNPHMRLCGECGSQIVDRVVRRVEGPDGEPLYEGQTFCDCTTDHLTRQFADYGDAQDALLRHCGASDEEVGEARRRRVKRRKAALEERDRVRVQAVAA